MTVLLSFQFGFLFFLFILWLLWLLVVLVVVQSLSHVQLFATPCTASFQVSLSFSASQSLLKLTSIESMMPSYRLWPLLTPSPTLNLPASRSSPMSQLFTSGGLSIRASASVLPVNIQGWFPLGLTDLISLLYRGFSGVFSSTTIQKHLLWHSAFFMFQLSHPYMTTGKTIALTRWTFVSQVMCLLFNMLSMFVIAFLPRSKRLLISWLQWLSTVIWGHKKIKSIIVSTFSPPICHKVMGLEPMIFVFWMLISSQLFHSPLSPSSRGSLVPLCFLPYG